MNRFKLVCVLIVFSLIGLLLAQNKQPLFLKFFCPDVASSDCLYRTPSLPLAVWMAIFAIAGIVSSLIWQFFSQLTAKTNNSSSSNRRPRDTSYRNNNRSVEYIRPPQPLNQNIKPTSDWEQINGENWDSEPIQREKISDIPVNSTVQKTPSEPQDSKPSDTIYSYRFESDRKSQPEELNNQKTNNLKDEVYDANYRTINNPKPETTNAPEEDEEWI